jgi:N utilization substance protein B
LFSILFRDELSNPSFRNDNYEFCQALLSVAIAERDAIDAAISAASTRWSIQRMARVDRNILRVAVAELIFFDDIPASVSINEAIEIAKRYGTADSSVFINGLLDRVATTHAAEPPPKKVAAAR